MENVEAADEEATATLALHSLFPVASFLMKSNRRGVYFVLGTSG